MNCQKNLFSLRPDIHYLNCAFKAPLLKSAEEVAIKALIRERNPADIFEKDFFEGSQKVKESFGELVNCNSLNVAIIPSASYGFSTLLKNTKTQPGKKALTIKDEFPSIYLSLKRWCQINKNELIVIAPDNHLERIGENWTEKILNNIDKETSIVMISSIHWMNGLKFDLKRIGEKCQQVGTTFVVDGTQSVGALDIDIQSCKIDALVCASYKCLLGPYSLSVAYISDKFENGIPLEESWLNRIHSVNMKNLTNYETTYQSHAGKYNVGETSNFILMPMLHEALKQINLWKPQSIQNYCKNLGQPLINYLQDSGVVFENKNYFSYHLFPLKLPNSINLDLLKHNLEKNNIYISLRGDYLRISLHLFNDSKDIEKLIAIIDDTKNNSS